MTRVLRSSSVTSASKRPRPTSGPFPRPPPSRKKQKTPAQNRSSTLWKAYGILNEDSTHYVIAWKGRDPSTGKSWEPTREPKRNANAPLVREWKQWGGRRGRSRTIQQLFNGLGEEQGERLDGTPDTRQENMQGEEQDEELDNALDEELDGEQDDDHDDQHDGAQDDEHDGTEDDEHDGEQEDGHDGTQHDEHEDGSQDQDAGEESRDAKPGAKDDENNMPPGYHAAKAIVGEKSRRYLVRWAPDSRTGEEFPDTWEPMHYVADDLVHAWKQKQKEKQREKNRKKRAKKHLTNFT